MGLTIDGNVAVSPIFYRFDERWNCLQDFFRMMREASAPLPIII